jgi:hypothetical protein
LTAAQRLVDYLREPVVPGANHRLTAQPGAQLRGASEVPSSRHFVGSRDGCPVQHEPPLSVRVFQLLFAFILSSADREAVFRAGSLHFSVEQADRKQPAFAVCLSSFSELDTRGSSHLYDDENKFR